ncbi:MAG: zinc ribbon domain-containing protein, partial [Candidatus Lokiarchaeia archaeon]|nr:zinc ribbon domain-containing protein [Candidatus Lokiarchaeia archaeon]
LACFQIILILLDIFCLTDFKYYISTLETNYTIIMNKLYDGITLTANEWNFLGSYLILSYISIFLQNLIGAIIISIAMCSVSTYVFRKFMKDEVSFIDAFKTSFNKRMLLVVLILGICLPLSSLLLFIPAIFVFIFFIFMVFTFNMESKRNPILDARELSKGGFWKISGIFAINVILISIISYFYNWIFNIILNTNSASFIANYNSWYNPITRNYGMIISHQILVNFPNIICSPLFICLLTSLFSSFKAKKDLIYLNQQGMYPTRGTYKESYPLRQELYQVDETEKTILSTRLKEKYYCPFCGHFISIPENFCPKCGENLSFDIK